MLTFLRLSYRPLLAKLFTGLSAGFFLSLAQAEEIPTQCSNTEAKNCTRTENLDPNAEKFQTNTALYQLKIQGIEDPKAEENAQIYTDLIAPQEMDGSARNLRIVKQTIEKAIGVFGYFNSQISFKLEPAKEGKKLGTLFVTVKQGPVTKIVATDVKIEGEAKDDTPFQRLLETLPPVGSPLSQESYDNFKDNLQQLGVERGYFDANFTRAHLDVRPSSQQAWWHLSYNSGERYKFGKFTFENNQIRTDYLKNIMQMQDGSPYNMEKLSTLSSDFSSSGWFNFVLFQPKVDKEKKEVDMHILFYPRKKNVFKVGLGYSTDVGGRFQLGWNKPWVDDKGQSLRSNLYFSKPKQSVEATYRMPLRKHPLKYYYELAYGIEREKENDTSTNGQTATLMRYWNRITGWQNALGLRVRYDAFTQADESHHTLLIYPTASATRTRFRGGLFPNWGDSQRFSFDIGSKNIGSDVDFYRLQASSIWVRTLMKNHRFITRAEFGYLKTHQFDKIPPSLRFFVGGDRTVRGYGYKKISPKNDDGKLVGGSYMADASLEYNYQVYPKWWLATFFDSGLAADKLKREKLHYGAGFGIRWVSPVGPLKFDIAKPVHDKIHNKDIQFYLSLGSEL